MAKSSGIKISRPLVSDFDGWELVRETLVEDGEYNAEPNENTRAFRAGVGSEISADNFGNLVRARSVIFAGRTPQSGR